MTASPLRHIYRDRPVVPDDARRVEAEGKALHNLMKAEARKALIAALR